MSVRPKEGLLSHVSGFCKGLRDTALAVYHGVRQPSCHTLAHLYARHIHGPLGEAPALLR